MVKLPDSLSRKAVALTFDRISPVAWEKLFEREDQNGLEKLRTDGDFPGRIYYKTDGLAQWLIRNGFYTPTQIENKINGDSRAVTPTIRTHLLSA